MPQPRAQPWRPFWACARKNTPIWGPERWGKGGLSIQICFGLAIDGHVAMVRFQQADCMERRFHTTREILTRRFVNRAEHTAACCAGR
jgi:hypothetical protein